MTVTFANHWRDPCDGHVDVNNETQLRRLLEGVAASNWHDADRFPSLRRLHHSLQIQDVDILVERGVHDHGDMRIECSTEGMHWYVTLEQSISGGMRLNAVLPCPV